MLSQPPICRDGDECAVRDSECLERENKDSEYLSSATVAENRVGKRGLTKPMKIMKSSTLNLCKTILRT